jgi:hypothetical protein
MYQYASAVTALATISATGTAHLDQRRLLHSIALTPTSRVNACTAAGNQPCSKESCSKWPNSDDFPRGARSVKQNQLSHNSAAHGVTHRRPWVRRLNSVRWSIRPSLP